MVIYTGIAGFWSLLKVRRGRFDHVLASSPFPTVIYPAFLAARISNARLIFDVRDLWPLTLKKIGGYSARHPFIQLMQCAENFACRKSDLVLAVPQNSERYLMSRGLRANRFMHMPNGVSDSQGGKPLPRKTRSILEDLRRTGHFIVGYAGAIGLANSLECLVRSLRQVDSRVVLVLAGDGAFVARLLSIAAEIGAEDRVIFLGRINTSEVADLLSLVDVAYAAVRRSSLYRFGASMTKMNDYLMAGLPILYGVGDRGNPVEKSGCGIEFVPESDKSCAKAIQALFSMSSAELDSMGEKGRTWALQNQMWSKIAREFVDRAAGLND
jgi:glycosyltransferase involved in cell wall biosynthesis